MKINKISYKNFKSNIEETLFDFSSEKNLNVIKGENGCGKTTFIEAISLAFFGRQMFNSNNFTNDYIEFVTSRLSTNSTENIIEIKVLFNDEGKEYKLIRTIEVDGSQLNGDDLMIYDQDKVVDSCPFIEKFNYEIVKRFFLDGEKIVNLINDNKIIPFINEFIDTAFNLKTMKQIKSDLGTLKRKEFRLLQNTKHKHLEDIVNKQQKKLGSIADELSKLTEKITTLNTQVKLLDKEISKQGFISKSQIAKHINKKDELLLQRKSLNERLKTFLIAEIEYLMHQKVLNSCVEDLTKSREARLTKIVAAYKSLGETTNFELPSSISLDLEYYLCKKAVDVNNIDGDAIFTLIKQIKNNSTQITKVVNQLKKTEDGQKRLDVLDEHENSLQLLKNYSEQQKRLEESYKTLEIEFNNNQKALDKLNDEVLKSSIDANALNEQTKLNNVLEKYLKVRRDNINNELSEKSYELLQKYFLRKKSLIDGIKVTNDSIDVYIENKLVNYNNFSAGEKQMLIVGLIFAIIELSNLKTPLVLDSFVGRLDKAHTKNILDYLVNQSSCQTVLLVTDSEFPKERFDYLANAIGSIYTLENDGYSAHARRGYYEN